MNALVPVLLGAVLAPAVLGAGLVRLLGLTAGHGRRVFVAWSYLVGHFVQCWVTFGWLAAGRPLPGWLLPVLAAVAGTVAMLAAPRRAAAGSPCRMRSDPWICLAVAVLTVLLAERCLAVSLHAIVTGDEANIWSAKARLMFAEGSLRSWFGAAYAQHPDYPLQNPLVQVLAFASSGRVLLWENRLPLQAFGVALLLLLSVVVERRLPRWLAIVVLVAFATTRFTTFAPTACSDVLLAFALLAVVDAWSRFHATGSATWWRLGCVALAAMLASKSEGAMLALALIAAAAVTRVVARAPLVPRWGTGLLWLLVPLATVAAGQWFNVHHGLANDLTSPGIVDGRGLFERILFWFPARIGPVLVHFWRLLVDGEATRWLLLAMLLAPAVVGRAALRPAALWPWLVVVAASCGYVLVFVGTTADSGGPDGPLRGLQWHLDTAADRLLLHLLPVAVLALAEYLGAHRRAHHGAGT